MAARNVQVPLPMTVSQNPSPILPSETSELLLTMKVKLGAACMA